MLIECSGDLWTPVARELGAKLDAKPVYWSANSASCEANAGQWPDCIFHDQQDAVRAIAPSALRDLKLKPPDERLLLELAQDEAIALRMMDRLDYDGSYFSFAERRRHYIDLVSQWNALLEYFKPDFLLGPTSPHQVYDFIAYALCNLRQIPFIFFERTALPQYVFPLTNIRQTSRVVFDAYKEIERKRSLRLDPAVASHLERLRGHYSAGMPDYERDRRSAGLTNLRFLRHHVHRLLLTFFGVFRDRNRFGNPPLMKRHGRDYRRSRIGSVEAHINRIRQSIAMMQRLRFYKRNSRRPNLQVPFVYVALSYQPERTSSPNAGYHVDQYLMLERLAATVPRDWKIYVKEHFRQFHAQSRPHLLGCSRDREFYERLVAMENVELMPVEMNPFALIDASRAVATVSGSAGWEALVRGRPALVFAQAWYSRCPGAFEVFDDSGLASAIRSIAAGEGGPESNVIDAFARAIPLACRTAYTDPILKKFVAISATENASSLASMILTVLQKMKQRAVA